MPRKDAAPVTMQTLSRRSTAISTALHVWLMDLDDVAVGVGDEHLVPSCDGPLAVVGIANSQFVAATHEAPDVVGAEAVMALRHRIDELLHLEAGLDVALGPVELGGAVGQEVHVAAVAVTRALRIHPCVLLVADRAEVEQLLIELRQTRQIVGAEIEVMELEFHDCPPAVCI